MKDVALLANKKDTIVTCMKVLSAGKKCKPIKLFVL